MPKLPLLRRRRFLVSRSQTHLVAFQLAYHLLFVLVIAAGLLGPLVAKVESAASPDERVGFARVLLYFDGRFWWLVGVMLAASAIHTIFVTHRVVGPLVRFRRMMREIAAGKLAQRIKLRDHDYLDDEAADLNEMSASLVARMQAVKASAEKAARSAAEAERALHGTAEHGRIARDLRRCLDDLEGELAWFDCSPPYRGAAGPVVEESPTSAPAAGQTARRA